MQSSLDFILKDNLHNNVKTFDKWRDSKISNDLESTDYKIFLLIPN